MKFSTLKRTKMTKNKAGKFYKPTFFTLDNFIIFKIFHVKHSSIKSSKLQIIKLSIPQSMTHLKFCLWNFPVFQKISEFCLSSQMNVCTRIGWWRWARSIKQAGMFLTAHIHLHHHSVESFPEKNRELTKIALIKRPIVLLYL